MKTVKEIYKIIDNIAPFDTSMDFDNCGILVGDVNAQVKKVLIALDITPEVVNEAVDLGAELIISHHPVIFKPIKRLMSNDVPYMLANKAISAICAHTNLDMSNPGVNTCLAERLGIKNTTPLSVYKSIPYNKIVVFVPESHRKVLIDAMSEAGAGTFGNYTRCSFTSTGTGEFLPNDIAKPFIGEMCSHQVVQESRVEMICEARITKNIIDVIRNVHPYEEPAFDVFETKGVSTDVALGIIGDLENQMTTKDFAEHVKNRLKCEGVRYTDIKSSIKRVAVCSGSGGDMVLDAYKSGADVLVTGEIKHNMILDANKVGINIVDAGHFKTEEVVVDFLRNLLESKCKDVEFYRTKVFTDKIKYI